MNPCRKHNELNYLCTRLNLIECTCEEIRISHKIAFPLSFYLLRNFYPESFRRNCTQKNRIIHCRCVCCVLPHDSRTIKETQSPNFSLWRRERRKKTIRFQQRNCTRWQSSLPSFARALFTLSAIQLNVSVGFRLQANVQNYTVAVAALYRT